MKKYRGALLAICSIVFAYYLSLLLHEWGHGTVAWLFGYKSSPFAIQYGGLLMLHADENVPYDQILAAHHDVEAALIGIAGVCVSVALYLFSLLVLRKIEQRRLLFSFFYWLAVINMIPIFQYFTVQTFSPTGDTGRFNQGLHLSPWWILILGTIFVFVTLLYFFKQIVPKAYRIIPIRILWSQRRFLLASLAVMFLAIYTHGYNPLSDKGQPFIGKVLAVLSFMLVPVLFWLCNPSRKWVKQRIK